MYLVFLIGALATVQGSFSPQRTAIRDKLFFGIEGPAETGSQGRSQTVPALPPIKNPPASSQLGINSTATQDRDLNDFGSLGPPPEVIAKREQEALSTGKTPKASFFVVGSSSTTPSSSSLTVRTVLHTISIIWLVALLGACYYFLRQAFAGASRKYRIGSAKSTPKNSPTTKAAENMRIDREAYVYVADG